MVRFSLASPPDIETAKEYETFIRRKARLLQPSGFTPGEINSKLFDWQKAVVNLACRRGVFGGFEDCGLGKSAQMLECSRQYLRKRGRRVLMICPLAVSYQMMREAAKFDIDVDCRIVRSQSEVDTGINICNYEKLHKFDASAFDGVICDEGSIMKSVDGKIRNYLLSSFQHCQFRQTWTATPAPNDYMEIGNQAEFLGAMTRSEMLSTYFVHDGGETSKWRLKSHAKTRFWEWMASWCVVLRSPADLGYPPDGFDLPPLKYHEHEIDGGSVGRYLFDMPALTMEDRRHAKRVTINERCEYVADMVNGSNEAWVVWCNLNPEGVLLDKLIPDAVEVAGRHSDDEKEERLEAFTKGDIRVLVTKSKCGGFGLNWQHCHNTAIFPSDSWESWYQMIRRFWRYGQQHPVNVHSVFSTGEAAIVANLKRKESDSHELFESMATHMSGLSRAAIKEVEANIVHYHPTKEMRIPAWLQPQSA